ncbi:MAG: glutathione S-transferase family protein [Cyanobacteria bacterium SID2]|nr:glutathione S-transferase family protein [Cyanobacteria bacterium SID2]
MLKLYYARPSLYSRPVWLALLEKQLDFQLVPVQLDGDQFTDEFRDINPFCHVPVLTDGDFKVFESAAILDYLEVKYPQPSLLPKDAKTLANVRMVQSVSFNELLPAMVTLILKQDDSEEFNYACKRSINILNFFENLLEGKTFFAGDRLSVADLVAGTLAPNLEDLGVSLTNYPRVNTWLKHLKSRSSWQEIELTEQGWTRFKRVLKVAVKAWLKRRRQYLNSIENSKLELQS